jgi:hypothetical protein
VFFTNEGAILIDFQTMMPYGPAPDLAFAIVTELDVNVRRASERELLEVYL